MTTINLDKYSLKFDYEFISFSKSRNKDSKDKSLNYKVTITRNRNSFTIDYMMGRGHVPHKGIPAFPATNYLKEMKRTIIDRSCEAGYQLKWCSGLERIMPVTKQGAPQKITPDNNDVLHCCLLDSDVLGHPDFESWAGDFGYDTDSRSAEKIYKECLANALQFLQLFKSEELEGLRELFQDY
jgi:hypothetical protein